LVDGMQMLTWRIRYACNRANRLPGWGLFTSWRILCIVFAFNYRNYRKG